MSQPNFYAIIPADVRYDANLKPNAKLLYGEITALCTQEGFCWAENEYFASLYGVNTETVSRWISQLRDGGYINVDIQKSEGNKRKIGIAQKVNTYCQKTQEVMTKKTIPLVKKGKSNKESITINNTINIDGTALEFLERNYPSRFEPWCMQHKTKLGTDYEHFCNDYNCKVIEEKLDWEPNILFARLTRLSNNWQRRGQNGSNGGFVGQQNNTVPAGQPAYMNKPLT